MCVCVCGSVGGGASCVYYCLIVYYFYYGGGCVLDDGLVGLGRRDWGVYLRVNGWYI